MPGPRPIRDQIPTRHRHAATKETGPVPDERHCLVVYGVSYYPIPRPARPFPLERRVVVVVRSYS